MGGGSVTKLARCFYAHLKKTGLLPPGTHVLAACSGGPDSLALLLLLQEIAPMRHLTVTAAHYEHGLRGAASKEDAAFVAAFCAARGIPCRMGAAEAGSIAGSEDSVETAARRLRYEFLEQARTSVHADVLCTAHHADDQAETVLMHLLRGTGPDGLAGIPARDEARHLVRPLLPFRKTELLAYCQAQHVTPRHDATNDVPDGLRNRVRLELLPELARDYNPRISEGLCRLAELAAEEREAMETLVEESFYRLARQLPAGPAHGERSIFRTLPASPALEAAGVLALPRALSRRVLRRYLAALGHPTDVSFERMEALLSLLAGATGDAIELPGLVLTLERGWLRPCRVLGKGSQKMKGC